MFWKSKKLAKLEDIYQEIKISYQFLEDVNFCLNNIYGTEFPNASQYLKIKESLSQSMIDNICFHNKKFTKLKDSYYELRHELEMTNKYPYLCIYEGYWSSMINQTEDILKAKDGIIHSDVYKKLIEMIKNPVKINES